MQQNKLLDGVISDAVPGALKQAHLEENTQLINKILSDNGLTDVEDHTFLNIIKAGSRVLDLGAWRGNFAADMEARYGCQVDVFEPNKNQVDILKERFAANKQVIVHPIAVGGKNETVVFYPSPEDFPGNEKGSSLFSDSPYVDEGHSYKVRKVRLADVTEITGVAQYDLIKMDIEGAEVEIFDDEASFEFLSSAKMLTIEFHFKMPVNDQILIPKQKIHEMIQMLKDRGFSYVDFGRNFQYIDCLFYKANG